VADIPEGNPLSIEHLIVHFCEKGNGYLVKERRFLMEMEQEKRTHP
jgi:cyanophycinase